MTDARAQPDGQPPARVNSLDDASPFTNWQTAKRTVMQKVSLSQAFNTLRDMGSDAFIEPTCLETVKVLGEGAYAVVEKAWYQPPGGGARYVVAVKRLKKELFRNADDLVLFIKEVELMRKLRHRNIVDFVGAGRITEESDAAYVVQEYCEGGTLKALVTRQMLMNGRRLYTNAQALDMCAQMARGLKYLHRASPMVIHRDLKLENVLLKSMKPVEGQYYIKIADFGLSRRVEVKQQALALRRNHSAPGERNPSLPGGGGSANLAAANSTEGLQQTWSIKAQQKSFIKQPSRMLSRAPTVTFSGGGPPGSAAANRAEAFALTGRTGSLMYMAPEVFREQPYSEKADVFSFAIMMYEVLQCYIMLSAVAVRGTYEELEAYAGSVAAGYRPPLHPQWPDAVRALITACWDPEPGKRPTMDEVVTRIEGIQASGELETMDHPSCCAIS